MCRVFIVSRMRENVYMALSNLLAMWMLKSASEDSEGGEEHGGESLDCLRESVNRPKQMSVQIWRLKVCNW